MFLEAHVQIINIIIDVLLYKNCPFCASLYILYTSLIKTLLLEPCNKKEVFDLDCPNAVVSEIQQNNSHCLFIKLSNFSSFLQFLGQHEFMLISFFLGSFDYLDAIWFLMVTCSTVGYGDVSPKTVLGKIAVMFFLCSE